MREGTYMLLYNRKGSYYRRYQEKQMKVKASKVGPRQLNDVLNSAFEGWREYNA